MAKPAAAFYYGADRTYRIVGSDKIVPSLPDILTAAGSYNPSQTPAGLQYRADLITAAIAKGFTKDYDTRLATRGYNAFCRAGFIPAHKNKVLYNDQLNYACHAQLIGAFDYKSTIKAQYPAIVVVKLKDQPHAAGLELAAIKLAAVRNGLTTSAALCGLLTLQAGYEYAYTDMTDPVFEQAFKAIVKRGK